MEFEWYGAVGGTGVDCKRGFDRDDLTAEQLDQLTALDFLKGTFTGGYACDSPGYRIVIRYMDGTALRTGAGPTDCANDWVIDYCEFDALARSLGCMPAWPANDCE